MDKLFDLRDREFRRFFMGATLYYCDFKNLSLFNKEEITDRDLLEFYFEYSSGVGYRVKLTSELRWILFNYKMERVNEDRLIKFWDIVKEKTGIKLTERVFYGSLIDYLFSCDHSIFDELVDIFLDEV